MEADIRWAKGNQIPIGAHSGGVDFLDARRTSNTGELFPGRAMSRLEEESESFDPKVVQVLGATPNWSNWFVNVSKPGPAEAIYRVKVDRAVDRRPGSRLRNQRSFPIAAS
jgi:hypothetical protein